MTKFRKLLLIISAAQTQYRSALLCSRLRLDIQHLHEEFRKSPGFYGSIWSCTSAFQSLREFVRDNEPIQRVLGLFFTDILDFYSTVLKLFKLKRVHAKVLPSGEC